MCAHIYTCICIAAWFFPGFQMPVPWPMYISLILGTCIIACPRGIQHCNTCSLCQQIDKFLKMLIVHGKWPLKFCLPIARSDLPRGRFWYIATGHFLKMNLHRASDYWKSTCLGQAAVGFVICHALVSELYRAGKTTAMCV